MALVYTEEYTAEDFYKHQDISMNLIHKIKDCQTRGPARFNAASFAVFWPKITGHKTNSNRNRHIHQIPHIPAAVFYELSITIIFIIDYTSADSEDSACVARKCAFAADNSCENEWPAMR